MTESLRWSLALAVAILAALAAPSHAQRILYPPPGAQAGGMGYQMALNQMTMNQQALNTFNKQRFLVSTMGNGAFLPVGPGFFQPALGVNPVLATAAANNALALAAATTPNPYALSTLGSFNPYLAGSASLGASPYSLSTMGGGYGSSYPYYPSLPPEAGPGIGYGAQLSGMANLTSATGRYWKDVQTASLMREKVRQEALNTERRRIEFAQWYDSVRPTALTMRAREQAADLEVARQGAPDSDILSGRALNTLLQSIRKASSLNRGPTVPLAEDVVQHLNVTAAGGNGSNAALLKDRGKLNWPPALQEATFDEPRKRLTRNLQLAVQTVKDGETVRTDLLKDIRADFKTIDERLDEIADELEPSQYIEARRFLRQLDAAISTLGSRKAANYFNGTWRARGKNVAELVENMTKEGLVFAPAGPGDEAAYRAANTALRSFEAGLQVAQKK